MELPSVKSESTSMKDLNSPGSGAVSTVRLSRPSTRLGTACARRGPDLRRRRVAGWPDRGVGLLDEEDQRDRDRAGNDRQREQRPVVVRDRSKERRRERRTDHRAEVIHPAVKPVHLPSRRRRRPRREHRVARRAAHALPDPIEHADGEDLRPRRRDGDERPRDRRDAVARAARAAASSGERSARRARARSSATLLTASAAPSMMPSETAVAPRTRVRKNGRSG